MATKKKNSAVEDQGLRSGGGLNRYPLFLEPTVVDKSSSGDSAGFLVTLIVLAVVLAIMLPLTAMMYYDIVSVRAIVQEELRKVEKIRRKLEQDQKDKEQDAGQ